MSTGEQSDTTTEHNEQFIKQNREQVQYSSVIINCKTTTIY